VLAVLTVVFSVKYRTHRGFERKDYLRHICPLLLLTLMFMICGISCHTTCSFI